MQDKILYTPPQEVIENANVTRFKRFFSEYLNKNLPDYAALHAASVAPESFEKFYAALIEFTGLICERTSPDGKNVTDIDWKNYPAVGVTFGANGQKFFPDIRLNYTENLIAGMRKIEHATVIVFRAENQIQKEFSLADVIAAVGALTARLRALGVKAGDRVAGLTANTPETLFAAMATTALGGVWSSCSPDFGAEACADRFKQIAPKIFFSCEKYIYNGKIFSSVEKAREILKALPSAEGLIFLPFEKELSTELHLGAKEFSYNQILHKATHKEKSEILYTRVNFNDPLFILYSSGTTGEPKCITHSVGGTLLQHLKEHQLHCDIKPNDTVFYYSTCGWMMWNWLIGAAASGARLALFDGSPFAPHPEYLFEYAEKEHFTFFGTSAKYLEALKKDNRSPGKKYDLHALRTVTSTGSPLAPESFDYVYSEIKSNLHLASISGGTDIVSCFVLGAPVLPVRRGEIQTAGLGMNVRIFNERGERVFDEKGELVCVTPFPCAPIKFWNDPNHEKYHQSYFSRFDNVWAHGDFAEQSLKTGGFEIYGRSDTVLNPGGVRIGTAEIYRQVEKLPEILESVCVGQDYQGDVRVTLFVKLREGVELSDDLVKRIKTEIKNGASPRHVPAIILAAPDIPRTKSGKITEIAVRDAIHGREIKNTGALMNPEALAYYQNVKIA